MKIALLLGVLLLAASALGGCLSGGTPSGPTPGGTGSSRCLSRPDTTGTQPLIYLFCVQSS